MAVRKNFQSNLIFWKKSFCNYFESFGKIQRTTFFVFLSTIHCPWSKLQSSSLKDISGKEILLKRKFNIVKKVKMLPNIFSGVVRTGFNTTRGRICGKKKIFFRKLLICIFVFVLAGWNFVLLPQYLGRLSKRVPKHNSRENILVDKKKEKSWHLNAIFPDFWLKFLSGVVKI